MPRAKPIAPCIASREGDSGTIVGNLVSEGPTLVRERDRRVGDGEGRGSGRRSGG
jgi:hypothetical protein